MIAGWPCLVVILGGVKRIGVILPSSLALNLVAKECITVGGGGAGLLGGFLSCELKSIGVGFRLGVTGVLIIVSFWFCEVCLSKLDDIFEKLVRLGDSAAGRVCGAFLCNWSFLAGFFCTCARGVVF